MACMVWSRSAHPSGGEEQHPLVSRRENVRSRRTERLKRSTVRGRQFRCMRNSVLEFRVNSFPISSRLVGQLQWAAGKPSNILTVHKWRAPPVWDECLRERIDGVYRAERWTDQPRMVSFLPHQSSCSSNSSASLNTSDGGPHDDRPEAGQCPTHAMYLPAVLTAKDDVSATCSNPGPCRPQGL
jgi:hypothetical protein